MAGWRIGALSGWALVLLSNWALAAGMPPVDAARHVDELLAKEMFGGSEGTPHKAAAKADDQTFLRRASLDLIGHAPTPEDITLFSLDDSSDKRARAVERLLANEKFGENWARYWRDVIFYRRSDEPRADRQSGAGEDADRGLQPRRALGPDRQATSSRPREMSARKAARP